MDLINKIQIKAINILISLYNIGKLKKYNLVSFGTEYGKWTVPKNIINESSSCILVGAGEDISFDLELLHNFGCKLVICDPTSKSKNFIEGFLNRGLYQYTDFIGINNTLYFEKETLLNKFLGSL